MGESMTAHRVSPGVQEQVVIRHLGPDIEPMTDHASGFFPERQNIKNVVYNIFYDPLQLLTGWSDSCRAGFAPARKWRLSTAHKDHISTLHIQVFIAH